MYLTPVSIARALGLAAACTAFAGAARADVDKLLLTGGVATIDGAAGGGLVPWATIGGYATEGETGGTLSATAVKSADYRLAVAAVAINLHDRVELSIAHQDLDAARAGAGLGLPGLHLKQDVLGVKWRLAGDAVLDSDSWWPQVAVGLLLRQADPGPLAPVLASLGASRSGADAYVSATKLLLGQGMLLNGTLRWSRANQDGLLGFGGTAHRAGRVRPEGSVAWLLSPRLAVGAEYRAKPDNLDPSVLGAGLKEDDWSDLFIAWAPSKTLSVTGAVVDLGHVVPGVVAKRQVGAYLSAQLAY